MSPLNVEVTPPHPDPSPWVELQHSHYLPVRGGVERKMERLSDALVQAGFRVTVCTSAPAAHTEAAAPGGVAVVPHRPFFTRLPLSLLGWQIYERRLQKFLQNRREPAPPQAILAFHFAYAAAARRVWPRVPIGFAAGAVIWDWFSSLYRDRGLPAQPIFWAKRLLALPVEREAVHAANAIFVESEALKARFVRFHPLCRQKIIILPPPVDTVRFRPSKALRQAIRKELGIPETMKVILGVGRLDPNKSYATLVEAMGLLKRQDCIVMIAGQGGEELRLKQTALRVGVLDRLRLIGVRDDIEAVYAGADIFAHPSVLESYAYVVLEAMSVGLPCIVSRAGTVGISADLTDGSNALLAHPHDPQDWANQISRLLAQPEYSADIGRRARRFCELRPGWPALSRRMLSELGIHHDVNSTHRLA